MAALPYMCWYPADYLADTAHLTTEEHGAYLLLLFNYWQVGHPLRDNNTRLANIARLSFDRWLEIRDPLAEFFEIRDGHWIHWRLEDDLRTANEKSDKARAAGRISARKRWSESNGRITDAERTLQQSSNHINKQINKQTNKQTKKKESAKSTEPASDPPPDQPSSKALLLSFDDFWNLVSPKIGKADAKAAWLKLKPNPTLAAKIGKAWIAQKQERALKEKYGLWCPHPKNPSTWINKACWDDDVMTEKQIEDAALLQTNGNGNGNNGNTSYESKSDRIARFEREIRTGPAMASESDEGRLDHLDI